MEIMQWSKDHLLLDLSGFEKKSKVQISNEKKPHTCDHMDSMLDICSLGARV